MLNIMNTDLYLSRLEVGRKSPSLTYLNELITAHQRVISFNNIAVYFRPDQLLNVELEPLFEKVILRGEGGYCFENNKVFYYLLKDLGFEARATAARVLLSMNPDVPRSHRTTIVTVDGRECLADVGFGRYTPTCAVPVECETPTGRWRIVKGDRRYLLQSLKDGTAIDLYVFDDGDYIEADFKVGNHYTNTHPDSRFRKSLEVVRIDGEIVEFIAGKTYTRIVDGVRTDSAITGQAEFERLLERFGINDRYDFGQLREA